MSVLSRVCWAFLARDVKVATSYRFELLLKLAAAIFPMLILYLPAKLIGDGLPATREYGGFLPFSVVGLGVMNFFMSSYGAFASALRNEQSMGTLESVLMSPVPVPVLVVASSGFSFLWALCAATAFIGGGALVYGIALKGSLALAGMVIALTTLVFVSMGVLSASFTMVWKRGDPLGPLLGVSFFLLGGVVYPTKVLPGWLEPVAALLPITHATRAVRGILLQGRSLAEVATELWILVGFVFTLLPLSLWAFSVAVQKAKRDGTLLQY
jgi:ABC-2 type transport system permease protein